MSFANIFRSISGEFEIGRVLLAGSGLATLVTPIGFEIWDMAKNGAHFDLVGWCAAYPAGLAAVGGIGVFTIGKKEKQVAEAKAIPTAAQGTQS